MDMTSVRDSFFISNKMSSVLEEMITRIDTLEEFEQKFSDEFLENDDHIGIYLAELLWKYDCKASVVSTSAMLTHSYVGNIVNGKKKNPSRDALICICLTIGTTVEEIQYLLKYAGQAPLYNKLFEEEQLKEKAEVYEKRGYVMKPLATIPELDLTLYSRCLVCRMNADGTFASLEKEDFEKFIDYLAM
jgi:hypothetical protein